MTRVHASLIYWLGVGAAAIALSSLLPLNMLVWLVLFWLLIDRGAWLRKRVRRKLWKSRANVRNRL